MLRKITTVLFLCVILGLLSATLHIEHNHTHFESAQCMRCSNQTAIIGIHPYFSPSLYVEDQSPLYIPTQTHTDLASVHQQFSRAPPPLASFL